jgi:hypothetical protein
MNRTDGVKLAHTLDEPRRGSNLQGIKVRVGDKQWMIPAPGQPEEPDANARSIADGNGDERDDPLSAVETDWSKRIPESLLRPMEDVLTPVEEPDSHYAQPFQRIRDVHGARRLRTGAAGLTSARSRPRQRARRVRETFQFGCVFGLLLGCLSMILFHQMEPNLTPDVRSTNADGVVLSSSVHAFELPAVKVQLLQSKPIPTRAEADHRAAALSQRGVPAVVHPQGKQYVVWTAAAVRAGHLQKWASASSSNGLDVQPVLLNLSVESVPALSGSNAKSLAEVSNWLSLSAAALKSLTAVQSDGGLPEDAYTAYDTARQQLPSSEAFAETGKSDLLTAYSKELDSAFAAYRKQQLQEAMRHTLLAYDLLSRLHL